MKKKSLIVFLLFLFLFSISADALFNDSINSIQYGSSSLAGGYLPLSFTIRKNARLELLEDEEKASLTLLMGYSLNNQDEGGAFDDATGSSSYLGKNVDSIGRSFFNPTGTLSLSLSQSLDKWNYSLTLFSRYSQIEEKGSGRDFSDSRYNDKEKIYASPWFYGERTNLTNYITATASRSYRVQGLDYMNLSLSFEAGPSWLLNNISNGGITLSDYYRVTLSQSESVVLKNENQTINLRWLRIVASHSNSLSYTFGSISPQNKINSYRMRGVLSDSFYISFSGPELYTEDTTISSTISYNNYLYFGGVQNEKSGKESGYAYSSNLGLSFNLRVFGFISFNYSTTYYIASAFDENRGLRGSGEVAFSFVL